MSLAVALKKYAPQGIPSFAQVEATPSGSYVTGGDTLNLISSTWSDPGGIGIIGYPSNPPGIDPSVLGYVGFTSTAEGSYAIVIPGATLGVYKLQIFTPGGTELAAGAYPADMLTGYFIINVPV